MHASPRLATQNQLNDSTKAEGGTPESGAMQQTICTHCRQEVTISPETRRCPLCGEDLAGKLTPEATSQYFYERAAALVEAERWEQALAETQTGLEMIRSSELLLLAAILSQRLGRFDLMRQYISQIPVGDLLREEGEWLLRSHQARQRLQRKQAQLLRDDPSRAAQLSTDEFAAMGTPEPLNTEQGAPFRVLPAALAAVLLIVAAWSTWNWVGSQENTFDPSTADAPALESGRETAGESAGETTVESTSATATAVLQALPATAESSGAPTDVPITAPSSDPGENVSEDVPAPAPGNIPDNVPDNVVQNDTPADSLPSLAASETSSVVSAAESRPFDILEFLRDAGRPDLAELSIDAQLQDGTLFIFGIVPWTSQRMEILELAETIDNVDEINSVNLVVRLPDTYTVQEGDTLWIIAYRLYAQPERWRDIQSANSALLPSPESLRTNMQLAVPPLD